MNGEERKIDADEKSGTNSPVPLVFDGGSKQRLPAVYRCSCYRPTRHVMVKNVESNWPLRHQPHKAAGTVEIRAVSELQLKEVYDTTQQSYTGTAEKSS